MGEPTHETVELCNGVARSNIKTLLTTIISIAIIVVAGWIGWTSHKNVDHESRICVVERSYADIKDDIQEAKKTITKSAMDLAGIQVLLQDIRQDQVRRQAKER